jgi:ABC-type transport system substrate-binding protein
MVRSRVRSLERRVAVAALVATACFERGGREERAAVPPPAPVAARADGWLAAEPGGAPDPTATLRVALDAEPATLDPFATLDAASARVLAQVVEGLACPTTDGGVEPCVARAWRAAPDGRTWRFTLDPRRRFADGTPITAGDVVASLDASRGVGHAPGPLGFALDDAVAITAPHADQIEVVVREDRPSRLRDLALVPIVPAAQLAAASLAERPIGSGPFAIADWVRGERIALARVDGAARRAGAARVELVVVADRADAIRQLAAGRLDVVAQVPAAEAVAAQAQHPTLVRFRYRQPAALVAVVNTRRPALADARTRRALVMTLDRAGVARAVLGGAPTLNGPWLPDQPRGRSGAGAAAVRSDRGRRAAPGAGADAAAAGAGGLDGERAGSPTSGPPTPAARSRSRSRRCRSPSCWRAWPPRTSTWRSRRCRPGPRSIPPIA